jgi:NAD(P)-dependent dehydrogenase (short-subunit alcohol dehydrogenase family)
LPADTLANKVAVVTGATGVLCSAMVEALLRAGAKVALLNRRVEAGQALADRFAAQGLTDTMVCPGDVLERVSLEAARAAVIARWGRIDILVNGAGGNHPSGTTKADRLTRDTARADGFFGLDLSGFDQVNRLNLHGTLLPTQVFGEGMAAGSCIINISSMASTQPMTRVVGYAAAKAGIDNLTRWLSVHLAPLGVRVNAIAPGFFLTEQNRFLLFEADGCTPTARGGRILARTPMGRYGEARELGGALVFLCSDAASFVTGAIIPVDGGFLAYSGV